jgi:hypothetical protein
MFENIVNIFLFKNKRLLKILINNFKKLKK